MSRSYGVSLPSSLTVSLSSASVSSTRPPVSVSGTGRRPVRRPARLFSGACSSTDHSVRRPCVLSGLACGVSSAVSAIPFNALFRQRARVSLLRPRWDSRTPGRGILTASPSTSPCLAHVRSRLTPGRLASPGNPWSFGDGVSRPICRYLYLHLLFRILHHVSRHGFAGGGMLPYQSTICRFHVFGTGLMPDYYPCGAARLVSCYALFE